MTTRSLAVWCACALLMACADHSTARGVIDAGDAGSTDDAAMDVVSVDVDATALEDDAAVDCAVAPHDTGSVDPQRSEILQLPQGEDLLDQCSRSVPSPVEAFWVPSEAEVSALEAALAIHFQDPCVLHYWITLDDHYVQYIGIVSAGRNLIYASFVHQSSYFPSSVTPTPAYVLCDGGELAWGIVFDPSDGHFEDFAVNGSI